MRSAHSHGNRESACGTAPIGFTLGSSQKWTLPGLMLGTEIPRAQQILRISGARRRPSALLVAPVRLEFADGGARADDLDHARGLPAGLGQKRQFSFAVESLGDRPTAESLHRLVEDAPYDFGAIRVLGEYPPAGGIAFGLEPAGNAIAERQGLRAALRACATRRRTAFRRSKTPAS